jgi:hypothetical protein
VLWRTVPLSWYDLPCHTPSQVIAVPSVQLEVTFVPNMYCLIIAGSVSALHTILGDAMISIEARAVKLSDICLPTILFVRRRSPSPYWPARLRAPKGDHPPGGRASPRRNWRGLMAHQQHPGGKHVQTPCPSWAAPFIESNMRRAAAPETGPFLLDVLGEPFMSVGHPCVLNLDPSPGSVHEPDPRIERGRQKRKHSSETYITMHFTLQREPERSCPWSGRDEWDRSVNVNCGKATSTRR